MGIKDKKDISDSPYLNDEFIKSEELLGQLLRNGPIPNNELAENTNLYLSPRTLKRQLFFNFLYQLSLEINGNIALFGVRWGREISLMESLRTIYEPFNSSRKIIAFDTFEGFPSVDQKDQKFNENLLKEGHLSTTKNYIEHLKKVLIERQKLDPLPNIERTFIVKGDATEGLKNYLEDHPESIFSFIYFDFDLYKPTIECLKQLIPFLTKGSVIGFDQLNSFVCPGETIALRELLGTNKVKVQRSKQFSGHGSFFIWE